MAGPAARPAAAIQRLTRAVHWTSGRLCRLDGLGAASLGVSQKQLALAVVKILASKPGATQVPALRLLGGQLGIGGALLVLY